MSHNNNGFNAMLTTQKTHQHCKSPGCMEIGTCQPHDEYPNILFCAKHGRRLIIETVKSIVDGTHPDLRE